MRDSIVAVSSRKESSLKTKILRILALPLLVSSCGFGAGASDDAQPCLIISSGFQPQTGLYAYNANIYGITGIDASRNGNNDWDLANQDSTIGDIYFKMEEDASAADRNVEIVDDPVDKANLAVEFRLAKPTEANPVKGRVQMEIGENAGLSEVYYKYRMFIPSDFASLKSYTYKSGDWLTLMELWGGPDVPLSEPYPFRITLYVIKTTDNSDLEFGLRAETIDRSPSTTDPNAWRVLWEERADGFVIPLGEWFAIDAYYKQGDASSGVFRMSAKKARQDAAVLFDIHNYTNHPSNPNPQGLRWINPVKLYCSGAIIDRVNAAGGLLHLYFDDFEFWRNKRPE